MLNEVINTDSTLIYTRTGNRLINCTFNKATSKGRIHINEGRTKNKHIGLRIDQEKNYS